MYLSIELRFFVVCACLSVCESCNTNLLARQNKKGKPDDDDDDDDRFCLKIDNENMSEGLLGINRKDECKGLDIKVHLVIVT